MRPIKTERSNFVYKGDEERGGEVMDLPCQRAEVSGPGDPWDGARVVYSVWEPSPDERELVAKGGNIRLGIYGMEPIPPVSVEIVEEGGE